MDKTFTKALFLLLLPLLVITAAASAQTITVGAVDPGPYGQGSSITLPFHVDNASGCITVGNVYRLYLSDASGNFSSQIQIGTYNGFYGTFVNGIIPAAIPTGTGYRLKVVSTTPIVTSTISNSFTINAVGGVTAGITSNQIISVKYPEVFGACGADKSNPSPPYEFIDQSTSGSTVTAQFLNEFTNTIQASKPIPASFTADFTNYTIIVKAINGGIVGTKSYTLINNTLYNSFGGNNNGPVCISTSGTSSPLVYTVTRDDGTQGIRYNYPGLIYNIKWGDGSSTNYTYCEIDGAQGKVSHEYSKSSCGNVVGTQRNVFQIDLLPVSEYCPNLGTPFTGYAKVLTTPTNAFLFPDNACTNTPVTFKNISDPGQDPNNNGPECKNADARYVWLVNGVQQGPVMSLAQPFVYTFPSSGNYTVVLRSISNNTLCPAKDVPHTICVQDPPKPDFIIPSTYCISSGPLTPDDKSIVDPGCTTNNYKWKQVSGPLGGATFNAAATTPQITFNQIGVYKFQLDITTASCGVVSSSIKTIVVNATPTVTLSPDAIQCGKGVTLDFSPTATATKATLTGTAQTLPDTYNWTVTGASGGTFSFTNGTTANSQYPRITFNDYDVYTITATHINNCGGPVSSSQKLTFVAAPTVSAGPPQNNICEGTPIILTGTPGVGGLITSVQWTSTTGGTFTNSNSPNASYLPSAADINLGQVILNYTVTTSLPAPCNQITSQVPITIVKKARVTSSNTQSVCSGGQFNYNITSANTATTFTWTAALTSGTASGFGPAGSGAIINDIINNNTAADAVVTYTITPTLNGCPGTPFDLKLTVHPLPVITATPVDAEICSNQPANITLTSNINPTTYTWTSVASAGITGNTNSGTAATVASIQDILVNNSGAQGTVTYTVIPYNGTCPGTPKAVIIKLNPAPVIADAGSDIPVFVCPGTYQLQGNNPSPGTGEWSAVPGITFSDKNDPHAIASGLLPGQTYQFRWTIIAAVPGCPPSSDMVTVTRNNAAVGGTTATNTLTVCAGTDVVVTLTGQVGTIVWQRSIDGGLNWISIAPLQTTATLIYPNITQTTQFRALVTSGACDTENSTVTTISVVSPPPLANAGIYSPLCNQTSVNLAANDPGTFTGKWELDGLPVAGIVIEEPNNPNTRVNGLIPGNTYKFRWTIFAKAPCTTTTSAVATIINGADITPNFIPVNQVCGSGQVAFINTTVDVPGTTYLWDFGDGSTSTLKNPTHSFQPNADGTDRKLTVSLTVINSCGVHLPKTADITISPAVPVVVINPSTADACGSLSLTVKNQSPGTNKQYDFFLVDENGIPKGQVTKYDKTDAIFPTVNIPNNARWYVYMEATNNCDVNNPNPIKYPIDVAQSGVLPVMSIKDNKSIVCLGSPVTFLNLTANATIFSYRVYNDAGNFLYDLQAGKADYNYIFPNTGKYQVSILASNTGCGAAESSKFAIEVVPLPQPDFTFTVDVNNIVTFVNKTPDAGATPATSLTYKWNFGDGSATDNSFSPAQHAYSYENSPYTVSLVATAPGSNCLNIKTHTIEIKFTGELFLPNAFQPASTVTDLRTFKAKGQKLKEWRMQIFNNWGQLIWQTTALGSNGEPTEGWDGTFKGAPVQQGVYVWQASATFINGTEWKGMSYKGSLPKRSGYIHLLR